MKFALFITSCLLASALGAPRKAQKVGELRPAYQKNIEIIQSGSDSRIVSGSPAHRDQFPYQVSLTWGYVGTPAHICGGSIIAHSVIITAGHCIDDYGTFTVEAGILDRGEKTEWTESRSVKEIITHPEWPGGSVVHPYDLALMVVATPWTWTQAVQPIDLPHFGEDFEGNAILSGWGRTINGAANLPVTLQYANKHLHPHEDCVSDLYNILGTTTPLDETMLCTSGSQGISACGGDSGGPLAQNGILLGVVSWGITPCGTIGAPSVYTKVSTYRTWINQYI